MTVSPLSQEFIAGFQQGSYESVRELYHLYYSSLLDFATQLTLNKPEAHHIVQETFIKLYAMRSQFDNEPNIKAFLYITVRNICFNYIKSAEAATANNDEEAYNNDARIREEALPAYFSEIQELPDACREVFQLIFCERLSVPDAAEQLHRSAVTVAQERIQAIRLLRKRLVEKELFSIPLFIYFLAVACGR